MKLSRRGFVGGFAHEEEMARFMTAFKEIMPAGRSSTGAQ